METNDLRRLGDLVFDDRLTDIERKAIKAACDRLKTLGDACESVLIFHAGRWDHDAQQRWYNITQNETATTRVLCDHIRSVL